MEKDYKLLIKIADELLKEGEELLGEIGATKFLDLIDKSKISTWKIRVKQFLKENCGQDSAYYQSAFPSVHVSIVGGNKTDAEKIKEITDGVEGKLAPLKAVIKDWKFKINP